MALASIPMEPALARDGLVLLHQPMPNIGSSLGSELSVANENVWVEVVASTSDDVQYIVLSLLESHSTGSMVAAVVDIGVGAAASEVVIAEELWCQKTANQEIPTEYRLPLQVASGSRVSIRYNTLYGTRADPLYFVMSLYGSAATLTTYAQCDMIGLATTVAATANTKSAWAELTASTSNAYSEVIVGHINPTVGALDTSVQNIDVATGASASEVVIIGDLMTTTDATADICSLSTSPRLPVPLASGVRVAARISNQDAGSNSTLAVCVWGFR